MTGGLYHAIFVILCAWWCCFRSEIACSAHYYLPAFFARENFSSENEVKLVYLNKKQTTGQEEQVDSIDKKAKKTIHDDGMEFPMKSQV